MLKVEGIDEYENAEEMKQARKKPDRAGMWGVFHNNFLCTNLCEMVFRNYELRHSLEEYFLQLN